MSVREEWVEKVSAPTTLKPVPRTTRPLATLIARDGPAVGPDGTRRRMTVGPAELILKMVDESGIAGAAGQQHLVRILRWHLGYGPNVDIRPRGLRDHELAHIAARAWELVNAHHGELPPLTNDRPAA